MAKKKNGPSIDGILFTLPIRNGKIQLFPSEKKALDKLFSELDLLDKEWENEAKLVKGIRSRKAKKTTKKQPRK